MLFPCDPIGGFMGFTPALFTGMSHINLRLFTRQVRYFDIPRRAEMIGIIR
jgi:hypothetical protein